MIPPKRNRKVQVPVDDFIHALRNRIERAFNRLEKRRDADNPLDAGVCPLRSAFVRRRQKQKHLHAGECVMQRVVVFEARDDYFSALSATWIPCSPSEPWLEREARPLRAMG
jgi:hypothetical protein